MGPWERPRTSTQTLQGAAALLQDGRSRPRSRATDGKALEPGVVATAEIPLIRFTATSDFGSLAPLEWADSRSGFPCRYAPLMDQESVDGNWKGFHAQLLDCGGTHR